MIYLGSGEDEVSTLSFSADGKRLITSGYDEKARIWDAESGKLLHVIERHDDVVYSCCMAPDGKRAMTGGNDCKMYLWDVESGEQLLEYQPPDDLVNMLCICHAGDIAAAAIDDGGVNIYRLGEPAPIFSFNEHSDCANDVDISADGRYAVSCGDDSRLVLYDLFSVDASGKLLLMHTGFGEYCLTDGKLGRQGVLPGYTEDDVDSAAISPDGGRLALFGERGVAVCKIGELSPIPEDYLLEEMPELLDVMRLGKGHGQNEYLKRVVSLAPGAGQGACGLSLTGHMGEISCAAESCGVIASGDVYGEVHLWEAESGRDLGDIRLTKGGWTPKLCISGAAHRFVAYVDIPKGGELVLCGWQDAPENGEVKITELDRIQCSGAPDILAMDENGCFVLAPVGQGLCVLDVSGGAFKRLRELNYHDDGVLSADISRDGRIGVSCGQDRCVAVFEVESGKLLNSAALPESQRVGGNEAEVVIRDENGRQLSGPKARFLAERLWRQLSEKPAKIRFAGRDMQDVAVLLSAGTLLLLSGETLGVKNACDFSEDAQNIAAALGYIAVLHGSAMAFIDLAKRRILDAERGEDITPPALALSENGDALIAATGSAVRVLRPGGAERMDERTFFEVRADEGEAARPREGQLELFYTVMESKDTYARGAALFKLSDEGLLCRLALECDRAITRRAAANKLKSDSARMKVALQSRDVDARFAAAANLEKSGAARLLQQMERDSALCEALCRRCGEEEKEYAPYWDTKTARAGKKEWFSAFTAAKAASDGLAISDDYLLYGGCSEAVEYSMKIMDLQGGALTLRMEDKQRIKVPTITELADGEEKPFRFFAAGQGCYGFIRGNGLAQSGKYVGEWGGHRRAVDADRVGEYRWLPVRHIACGDWALMLVSSGGRVVCGGEDAFGSCALNGLSGAAQAALSCGTEAMLAAALMQNGTVRVALSRESPNLPALKLSRAVEGWRDIADIQMGGAHLAALKNDGTVCSAGDNAAGQCETAGWRDIVALACGVRCTFGLDMRGKVHMAGEVAEELQEALKSAACVTGIRAAGSAAIAMLPNKEYIVFHDGELNEKLAGFLSKLPDEEQRRRERLEKEQK